MKKIMMRIKKNTSLRILSISIIAVFLVLVARVTYAYFAPEFNDAWQDVRLKSDLVDRLRFTIGDPLVINATTSTLPENGTNLVSESISSASLKANSTTNKASYNYKVYFKISDNNFVYSDGITPEIILSVTDNDNNPITNIGGLTYGTFNGVEGFDVTTANGMFVVANPIITSESSTNATVQEWHFTLTYLNLPTDQSANYNHTLKTEIILEQAKEMDGTLASYIISQYTDGSNGLYFHNENLENGANDNNYRYSGSNPNNYVCFGSEEATCPANNLYRIIGVFNELDIDTGVNQKKVKLISSEYIGESILGKTPDKAVSKKSSYTNVSYDVPGYIWSGDGNVMNNTWEQSTLINNTFNGTYLTNLGSYWSSMIAKTAWKVGGTAADNVLKVPGQTLYQNNIVNNSKTDPNNKKVGLMYVSDYAFAASPTNWTTSLESYNNDTNRQNNWLFRGVEEWTMSVNNSIYYSYGINENGHVLSDLAAYAYSTRPVFYLENEVFYEGGTGTEVDPFRITAAKEEEVPGGEIGDKVELS